MVNNFEAQTWLSRMQLALEHLLAPDSAKGTQVGCWWPVESLSESDQAKAFTAISTGQESLGVRHGEEFVTFGYSAAWADWADSSEVGNGSDPEPTEHGRLTATVLSNMSLSTTEEAVANRLHRATTASLGKDSTVFWDTFRQSAGGTTGVMADPGTFDGTCQRIVNRDPHPTQLIFASDGVAFSFLGVSI